MLSRFTRRLQAVVPKKMFSTAEGAAQPEAYAGAVQAMHWVMGSMVAGCVGFVLAAQNTEDKEDKKKYMFYHKSCGTTAALLIGPRIALRLMSKSPGPLAGNHTLENMAGSLSHMVLYGLITFLPLSGVAMGYFGGAGIPFWYTTFPAAAKEDRKPDIAKWSFKNHKLAGQALEYIVPLHIGATLVHVARGQKILARILPIGK